MRRDTSNPMTPIPMIQLKLPTSQGGRHYKPSHLETNNPVEALNRSTQHPQMGGDISNPKQVTKCLYMGGDTLNPNQTTQYLHMGGDTSNPNQIT